MRIVRWFKRLLWLGLAVYLVTLAAVVYAERQYLTWYGDGAHLPESDSVAVVLGSGIQGDGVLAYSARRRVALGVRLLAEGKASRIVISGGVSRYFPDEEASSMARHAISLGAPADAVMLETRARSTFENLLYTRDLLAGEGQAIGIIVTDGFHLPRAHALAWAVGLEGYALASVATPGTVADEIAYETRLREALAWWVNVLRLSIWHLNGKQWPL